jgi:hypothetical protein
MKTPAPREPRTVEEPFRIHIHSYGRGNSKIYEQCFEGIVKALNDCKNRIEVTFIYKPDVTEFERMIESTRPNPETHTEHGSCEALRQDLTEKLRALK